MTVVEINETLTEIDGRVRIESGPKRVVAVATNELLDDEVTASHYAAGKKDAVGKPIVLGEEMTYIDWMGERGWYVYELVEVDGIQQWAHRSYHADKADAAAAAQALLV